MLPVFSVALLICGGGGSGCRHREHWLRSESTGFIYGPISDTGKEGECVEIGRDSFHFMVLSVDEWAIVQKLLNAKITLDVKDASIEDFIKILNDEQRKTVSFDEIVEIKVRIPESWDRVVNPSCDPPMTAKKLHMKRIDMSCEEATPVYEILKRLRHEWRYPQFWLTIENSVVCLRFTDYLQSE